MLPTGKKKFHKQVPVSPDAETNLPGRDKTHLMEMYLHGYFGESGECCGG